MKFDSKILAFIVLNQINYKSDGEPFATLLKTCCSRIGFFRSLFSAKQNNRNSILSRAAAFISIERASIFYFSENKDFNPTEFHKWYWTLCADRYAEEWGRSDQVAQRFLQIIYHVRDEFENIPVVLHPEFDGYRKIAYSVANRVIKLTGSSCIQSDVQNLAIKLEQILEIFCSQLKNHHPDVDVVDAVRAFCNSKEETAEFFTKTLPFPFLKSERLSKLKNEGEDPDAKKIDMNSDEEKIEQIDQSSQNHSSDADKAKKIIPLSIFQLELVLFAKKKLDTIFVLFLKSCSSLKHYSYELKDEKYPEDVLFISLLLSEILTFGRFQKYVDDFSVEIYSNQSKFSSNKSLSLSDIKAEIKSAFDGIILLLLCCLPFFCQSQKGMDLANEIKRELILQSEQSKKSLHLIASRIEEFSEKNGNDLILEFIDVYTYEVLNKSESQEINKEFIEFLRKGFFVFANIVSASYLAAFEDIRFKKESETLKALAEVTSNTPHFEKAIRNSLGMPQV